MISCKVLLVVLTLMLLCSACSASTLIQVVNPSFESDVLTSGEVRQDYNYAPSGWTCEPVPENTPPIWGMLVNTNANNWAMGDQHASDGNNVYCVADHDRMGIYQTLAEVLQPNTEYTLSVDVFVGDWDTQGSYGGNEIALTAGYGTYLSSYNYGPAYGYTQIGELINGTPAKYSFWNLGVVPAAWSVKWYTVKQRFVTGPAGTDPNFGQPIVLFLRRGGCDGYTAFDNVRLARNSASEYLPYVNPNGVSVIDNPSFEYERLNPGWSNEGWNYAPTGWTADPNGAYKAIGSTEGGSHPWGVGTATDGTNVFVVHGGSVRTGIYQTTSAVLKPDTEYTLSIDVYAGANNDSYAGNYVGITVGGTPYLESYNPLWGQGFTQIGDLINGTPAGYSFWNLGYDTTASTWHTLKQRFVTGPAGTDSNFGKPLTVFVRRGDDGGWGYTAFDNVKLDIKPATIRNPSFEYEWVHPGWSIEGGNYAPTGWTADPNGAYKAIGSTEGGSHPWGVGTATDGSNVFVVHGGSVRTGIYQTTSAVLKPDTEYTLSIDVYAGANNDSYAGNYVGITVGGTPYLESYNPLWGQGFTQIGDLINGTPAGYSFWNLGYDTTASTWHTLKQRFVTGPAGTDPNFGKPLTVFVRRGDDGGWGYTAFDNVKLDTRSKSSLVTNPSFEAEWVHPGWSIEGGNYAPTGWTADPNGAYKAIGSTDGGNHPWGVGTATDGSNVFVVHGGSIKTGIYQTTSAVLKPDTEYTLSIDVYAGANNDSYAGNYVGITVGGTPYLESYNPLWGQGFTQIGDLINGTPAGYSFWNLGYDTTASTWHTLKQRFVTGPAGTDSNFGKPLTVFVRRGDDGGWGYTAFDNVVLNVTKSIFSADDAKTAADYCDVAVAGIVTAKFPGYCYIEKLDRSSGIRVYGISAADAVVGSYARIIGSIGTLNSGERFVWPSETIMSHGVPIEPMGMTNKSVGGGQFGNQAGVTGASGLNNIGMLVRTTGNVVETGAGWIKIDDGSGVGLKVIDPNGVGLPASGYVILSGISSCEKNGSDISRVIILTDTSSL